MTTVSVTKCKPDPRLFYNRKWTTIKKGASMKGNRKYDYDAVPLVASAFPQFYDKEGMNTDIKPMAVYVHGCKGAIKQNETKECLDILDEMLGDLA